jgi:hypothetical protein
MLISKKKLISLIQENLNEMPIDYGTNPERMNPDLERKLGNQETPYKDNPSIPQDQPEGLPSNFEEVIASKRFIDVINKVKHYTGQQGNVTEGNTLRQLQMSMMGAMREVLDFEATNKEMLEQLAIELVKKELAVPEGVVQYDAKLVGIGGIDNEGFSNESENPSEEEIEQEFGVNPEEASDDVEEFMSAIEIFNDEVAKRKVMNALIQGSSKKGHYMFELVADRLTTLKPNIVRLYGVLMSVNDMLYWLMPDEMMLGGDGEGTKAGKEEVDPETEPPTVRARGVFFPVLVHELIKGTMEIIATQGLPDDKRQADMVMGVTDTLPMEIWDLRFGPVIWERLIATYPDRLYDEDYKHIHNYLFSRISKLSTKEFANLMNMVIKQDPRASQVIERMVQEIEQHLRNEDWEEEEYNREMDNYNDEGDGGDKGDFDDFLRSLGISPSED